MNQHRTVESVEAEAALVRAQLVVAGADIRAHVDPSPIVDAAKASFARRTKELPTVLRQNATPIGLVLLGGAFGATLVGLSAPSRKASSPTTGPSHTPARTPATTKSRFEAAVLSTIGVGLGYIGGMFIPSTQAEERLLGEPKALMSAKLDEFLNQHTQGMKAAASNLFGASRLTAAMLIALAAAAEAFGVSTRTGRKSL
jgi:hypothetical protein